MPTVSILIAAAAAGDTLSPTLQSIADQEYSGMIEVLVAAADSATAMVAAEHGVVVIDNPSGVTPTGLNLAARSSSGEVLVRIDAHSLVPKDYVRRVVETLSRTGAQNVGGRQVPIGSTTVQRAIAAAMASRFGAGDARYRVGGPPGPTDTVYLGAFPRVVFEEVGGYDERFLRNQDYDLNQRIRARGGVVWFDPAIEVAYRPRTSFPALASQYFQYGRWKRYFAEAHSWSLRPRQLAAPLLVIILGVSLLGSIWWPALLFVPGAYLLALTLLGLVSLPRVGGPALLMPLALVVMHLSWGIGFLLGQTSDR